MADQYGLFFNSVNGDRIYDADSFAEWLNKFFTTGIFNGELEVIADSGMVVDVTPGYANINGKVRFFEQAQAFTLDPASGVYPRIDTIVVRLDTTNRIITTEYVKGEYSGLSPVPTAPVRTNGLYELVLAEIYIGAGATQILSNDITDKRADDSVCGWVTSTVEGVPMDQIVSQMNAQFMTWFEAMKDQLSEDAAGHLQLEIDTLEGALNNLSTTVNNHNLSLGIVENGTTAEQLHRKGQFFVLNGRFCYAKEDIAEGDTFELATNYMYTEIGTQLSELKSGLPKFDNYVDMSAVSQNGTFTVPKTSFYMIYANPNTSSGYMQVIIRNGASYTVGGVYTSGGALGTQMTYLEAGEKYTLTVKNNVKNLYLYY